uniref:Uncharacterized protein n=1 Tax=Pseudomonas phage RVTF4 TaxID=3236931 RepID=A0AB39CCG3_9VIRU
MAIYIPKPEPIEVYQWHKNGDAPGDGVINGINSGAVVARHPTHGHFTGAQECPHCSKPIGQHGVIKKLFSKSSDNTIVKSVAELNRIMCPGNWLRVHRDEKKRILGYSIVRDRDLRERYVDLSTVPQPETKK